MSFKAAVTSVAKRAVAKGKYRSFKTAKEHAAAEIAVASRNASPAAKKANPALKRVKG